jgi:putative ATP-dependent DNA ligase
MDKRAYFGRLDSTADSPAELFEHFETRSVDSETHYVLPDARHGVEQGTVIVDDENTVVRGFPSIPRILVLETGIPGFFGPGEPIVAEEKLNGSNVRIAAVDDVQAFTRSGYACQYTTNRVRELLDPAAFFADHPELMLCAELIGPETPYTPHSYDDVDSHTFRVFDIRDRESGEPLSVDARRDLCEEYGFPRPALFGPFSSDAAAEQIAAVITDLDAEHREGVVMKSMDSRQLVKYTTAAQHHDDLAHAFSFPFDYGRDFLFSRLIREAFQAVEFEEDDEELRERAHAVGESILFPMVETIEAVEAGETVGERHTVRGSQDAIDALLDHLRDQSIEIAIEADYRDDGQRVVEFVKVLESTRDRVHHFLQGGTIDT